jgi:hypothetical protein
VGRQPRPLEPRAPLARAFRRPSPVVDEPVKTEEPKS